MAWFFVDTQFAAWLPFEVLDRIRHVDLAPVDLSFFQALVQQFARRADKGAALFVLMISGRFTDHHHGDLWFLRRGSRF